MQKSLRHTRASRADRTDPDGRCAALHRHRQRHARGCTRHRSAPLDRGPPPLVRRPHGRRLGRQARSWLRRGRTTTPAYPQSPQHVSSLMMNLAEYRRSNTRLADFLPWAALVDEGIILNKDGSVQRTAKVLGPDLDNAVPAELVAI